jgi:hypothetical protein
MKLSEAIFLESTMLAGNPGGQSFSETKSGCALGMAAVAWGSTFRRRFRVTPVNWNERRTLGTEGIWGPWGVAGCQAPLGCRVLRVPRKMRIKDVIAHLFDFHVMKKKSWTLDQLAEWVQTWEREEISRMAIANQLYPGGVISLESRLDRLQPEQEWLQFRQAFESRRPKRNNLAAHRRAARLELAG